MERIDNDAATATLKRNEHQVYWETQVPMLEMPCGRYLHESAVSDLVDRLENTAASLETMLAHFGKQCPAGDAAARERVLSEAREILARVGGAST